MQKKILLVSSKTNICKILETHLKVWNYIVFTVDNTEEKAIKILQEKQPNLIILDTLQSQFSHYKICNSIKKESNIPIIILTSLNNISDQIMGLKFGADYFITKPFSPKELRARIKTVLKQVNKVNHTTKKCLLYIDNLIIDTNKRQIFKNKERIHLTKIEFDIVELLIINAGKKLSRVHILNRVWGYKPLNYMDARIVDVHISRLRSKIENDPNKPNLILTARGTGYMFQYFQKIKF